MDTKTEYESFDSYEIVKKEEFIEKIEADSQCSNDNNGLCESSKKIYKKRKNYQKIDNETRIKIIEEVQKNGKLLKNAAEKYNVNYSSAKSIFHVYRKEGRVLKKPFKGRVSKTVVQLNNPVVFVNLPREKASCASDISNYENNNKRFYSQPYHQMPMVGSRTIDTPISANTLSTNMVSILHPSTVSMLQSFCNQNISLLNQPCLPMGQNMVVHEQAHFIKPLQDPIHKLSYHQNYQYFNKNLFQGLPVQNQAAVSLNESLRKASMMNQWVKKQWKFIDMGS